MNAEDRKDWIGASDFLKALRLRMITGDKPAYVLTAVIEESGAFLISMVGKEDPAAVRALLAACLDLVGASETAAQHQADPNRVLN